MYLSMNLLTMRFYKQLRCSVYNNINYIIKRYKCVSSNEKSNEKFNNTTSTITSIKFPGYKVIYSFPYIVHARIFNKVKYRYTCILSVAVPMCTILQILDFLSLQQNLNITCFCLLLISLIHTFAYTCNNVIGSICYKEDDKHLQDLEVIISYINYWGKRIDLKTTVNNIDPFTDNPFAMNNLLEILNVKSCNQNMKLKMYLKHGRIIDTLIFYQIFGYVSK